jgi:hypothetical protein
LPGLSGRKEPRFGRGFFYGWRIAGENRPRNVLQRPSKKKPANAGFSTFNDSRAGNQA